MTKDAAELLAKAKSSLDAARVLIKEGFFDFAASRVYYAMYYVAETLLADKGKAYSSHSALMAAFGAEFAKTGLIDAKFHRWLIDAQDLRNTGDYGIGQSVSSEQVVEACGWAEQFIAAAEGYLKK